MSLLIGILAVQGAFIEHEQMLDLLDIEHILIRNVDDLKHPIDGLILPGGESTAMIKIMKEIKLFQPIQECIQSGLPVLGTCAGLILLASRLSNDARLGFQTMDVVVKRNAYGRQLGSFNTIASFGAIGLVPMTFIRAPLIESVGPDVEVLAVVHGGIVAARQNNQIGLAFHPELGEDTRIHHYFSLIASSYKRQKNG
jgi:pyridoxal 5'-phosphate synthase pdxT subunit